MDLEEKKGGKKGVNTKNKVDSARGRDNWRALCERGIEPSGSISD